MRLLTDVHTNDNSSERYEFVAPRKDVSSAVDLALDGVFVPPPANAGKSEGPAFARAIAASNLTFRALKKAGVLMRREIYEADAFRGEYAQEYLAVSHRWMIADAPDAAKMPNARNSTRSRRDSHPELKFVWFDYWCMPQHSLVMSPRNILWTPRNILWTYATATAAEDEGTRKRECRRTRLEDASLKWMLKNMSTLYVGCAVLILLDRGYQSRFWTSFEAWLALRTATAEGLANTPCPTDTVAVEGGLAQISPRASVATVYGAPSALIQSLQEEWAMCTREEAREKLRSPDVSVTKRIRQCSWAGGRTAKWKGAKSLTLTTSHKRSWLLTGAHGKARSFGEYGPPSRGASWREPRKFRGSGTCSARASLGGVARTDLKHHGAKQMIRLSQRLRAYVECCVQGSRGDGEVVKVLGSARAPHCAP